MINYTYYFTERYIAKFCTDPPVYNQIKIEKLYDFTHFFAITPVLLLLLFSFLRTWWIFSQNLIDRKNPLQRPTTPQFPWPMVNESFISNFRGGKLSTVEFPARSTVLRSKPCSSRKTGDYEIVRRWSIRRYCWARGVRVRREEEWLNYSALACATFQIGTMFRRIPRVITGQRILSCEIFVSGIDKELRSWHFNGVYSVFSSCSTRKGGSDWGLFIYRAAAGVTVIRVLIAILCKRTSYLVLWGK